MPTYAPLGWTNRQLDKAEKRIKRLEGLLEGLADAIETEAHRDLASFPDKSVLKVAQGIRAALHE